MIREYGKHILTPKNDNIELLKKHTKVTNVFYKIFLDDNDILPEKVKNRWEVKLNIHIQEDKRKQIFALPFTETDDSKLQSLQFKINHRIYYTNSFLMEINLKETKQ